MRNEQKGYLELIIYSLFAGIVGVFVKLVHHLDIYSIIFFRASIASIFILSVAFFIGRIKELYITSPFKTLLVGFFQGLSIFFYFTSILKTSVSNAIFLLYTAPIFSVIFAKIFFKEKIEKETLIGIAITLLGIFFILNPRTFSFNSKETLGNLMGLASGFFYSAMALTAKPLMKKSLGYCIVFWQYFIISIIFAFFIKTDSIKAIIENWWQLLTIGILCTGIAFLLFMEGVRKIKAQKIFIITTLEPLSGTIFALFFLKETLSVMTIIGAVLILYGVYRIATGKIIIPITT